MRMIREVNNGELDEFARITIEAFPGMKIVSQDDRGRMIQRLAHAMTHPPFISLPRSKASKWWASSVAMTSA